MTTTIQKWGNSQGVRIPKVILESVNWSNNEKIIMTVEDGKLIMKKDLLLTVRKSNRN